jgi:hypothetical protein
MIFKLNYSYLEHHLCHGSYTHHAFDIHAGFLLSSGAYFHLPAFAIHTCHQIHTDNLAVMLTGHAIPSHISLFYFILISLL